MGALRLVVLAEGTGETGGSPHPDIPPGAVLTEEMLGVAHLLVRRLAPVPEGALHFLRPLRLRGREAVGSDLTSPASLKLLLAWPQSSRAPDATVIVLDEDGKPKRAGDLRDSVGSRHPFALVVARPEVEAWLLADHAAVQRVTGIASDMSPTPDDLPPREAKARLRRLLGEAAGRNPLALRADLARTLDLDLAAGRSPSFAQFRAAVSGLLAQVSGRR